MSAAEPPTRPDLVIGVGHRYRCDDGVGPAVAEALAGRGLPAVVHEGEGSALLDLWEGRDHVIVVDAMTGDTPGDILRFDARSLIDDAHRFVRSTHDVGLPEAVAFGATLDRLPRRLEVIGIVGRNFTIGEAMSPEVRVAVEQVTGVLAVTLAR